MKLGRKVLPGLLAVVLLVTGCVSPTVVPTSTPEATATETATTVPPEPTATIEPTATPTQEATAEATEEPVALRLVSFTNEDFGIGGVVPEGWAEIAPGVYARGQGPTDLTRLIQQAAPGATAAQITAALLPQLGIEELPESSGTHESAAFEWNLYVIEVEVPRVGTVVVDLALTETDAAAYVVLLQAQPADYEALHEAVFLPAVDALAPLAMEAAESEIYEDASGLFTVVIPANWTAEAGDGYGILTSPDGKMTVYVMAVEAESVAEGVEAAWAVIDPDFDLEPEEIIQEPVTRGEDEAVTITYDTGDEDEIILAGGWLYEGVAYVEIFRSDLATLQKRASQLQIINSGYKIKALEEIDLTGAEPLPLSDDLLAELEEYIAEAMEFLGVPGAAVAIVQGDEIVYSKGFGVRDQDNQEPVTPETLMMIGSTTKSLTTMMMATLVDDGIMDWDTRVVDILPTFCVADPEITERITMRNLVCACTGVPRRDAEWLFNANELTAEAIIESLADFEFFTDFGEAFQYSNQMVATAGYISALAAGGEYGDLYNAYVKLMQERILDPIGMTSSTFSLEEATARGNYATPYGMTLKREYVPIPLSREALLRPLGPAGTLWSNVLDMGRYLITELNEGVAPDGTRVVSVENLAVTWEPQVAITAEASYGLGWIIDEYKGLLMIHHGGNTNGFTSDLAFLPEIDLGISVLTNQYGSFLNEAIRFRLLELLFQQEPEYDSQIRWAVERIDEALAELDAQLRDSVDTEAVGSHLGYYSNDALGEITLDLRDGTLILDAGEFQAELRPRVGEDGEIKGYFSITPGLQLELRLEWNADGEPIVAMGGGATEYRFERLKRAEHSVGDAPDQSSLGCACQSAN